MTRKTRDRIVKIFAIIALISVIISSFAGSALLLF